VLECPEGTKKSPGADVGAGLLPPPRFFNNCGGMKWCWALVDLDNAVPESNEANNRRIVSLQRRPRTAARSPRPRVATESGCVRV